jgi:putative ABC transport system substrate-binding protein
VLSGFFLLSLLALPPAIAATEVVILKSSDIAAYNQAVAGFKAALPHTITLVEYDLQGDLDKGRKLARKIRASDPALVFAVGLKAAKAAQLEIVDIPILYSMVLDPAKYGLSTPNMTGVLLEVPMDRQLASIKSLLPHVQHIGTLYDPAKTAAAIEDAFKLLRRSNTVELNAIAVSSEKEVPAALGKLLGSVAPIHFEQRAGSPCAGHRILSGICEDRRTIVLVRELPGHRPPDRPVGPADSGRTDHIAGKAGSSGSD